MMDGDAHTNITSHVGFAQLLISDQDYAMMVPIFCVLCAVMALAGCLGNAVTIATYISMRLKDGVAVSFLCLAISDFLYVTTMLVHIASLGLFVLERKSSFRVWFPYDPFGLYVFCSDIGILIYLVTVLATTFIAVLRCLCVTKPLQFKNILTRKRSMLCMAAFGIIAVASYLPILTNMAMLRTFDSNINATRYKLWISPNREAVKMAIWISRDVTVTFITEVVVIICVILMTRSLRASAEFRVKTVKYSSSLTALNMTVDGHEKNPSAVHKSKNIQPKSMVKSQDIQASKLSGKDVSVLCQVVLISTVYIVCNTPKVLIDLTVMFVPDFTLGRPYQNVYLTVLGIMELFQTFNSSFNICIFFKYNSKFKNHLCSRIKRYFFRNKQVDK